MNRGDLLEASFFARDTLTVAHALIGATIGVGRCRGRIVETEAYTTDAASHAVTRRHAARAMRDTFAQVYVYRIYGVHCCLNFTTDSGGVGAVLVRALQPLEGLAIMARRRDTSPTDARLAAGPARLCQALGIDMTFNGQPIGRRVRIWAAEQVWPVQTSPRIGITRDVELPWRFFVPGHPAVSRAAPKNVAASSG